MIMGEINTTSDRDRPSKMPLHSARHEVIDLTHPINVKVFRKWDQKEVAYTDLLRFIRISGASPDTVTVSRPGKHPLLQPAQPQDSSAQSQDSSAQLQEHPSAEAHMDVDAT